LFKLKTEKQMKTRTKKGVEGRYYNAMVDLCELLQKDERIDLNLICAKHGISKAVPTTLRKMGVIRVSVNGNVWVGDYPNLNMVNEARQIMNANAAKANAKRKDKIISAFQWEKPQQKIEPIVNYEYKPQPDTSLVSEFIDHHEQSLLPHVQSDVKTAENIKIERLFQLRIFGINLFTIKY